MASAPNKIAIPLDRVDEGLDLIGNNIRAFVQDNYALMHNRSDWHAVALAILALEELAKYYALKQAKEIAIRNKQTSAEVDERLFGYGNRSHEYKLRIAKDQKLIPLDNWTINTGKFDLAYFDSAHFDAQDVVISSALRNMNMYVDWKDGNWRIGTGVFEPLRLKVLVDSIIESLERNRQRS